MGPIGMPELVVIFVVFMVVIAVPALVAIGLVLYFKGLPKGPPMMTQVGGTQDRLREIDELRRANLISEEEYDAKRKQIMDGL